MPSYSVNLNAVVAQAATAVTRLQVVCAYGGSDTQVCVATTPNLALAGGKLRGVAIESQAAGFPIQIVDFGTVNGTLTGSGEYVSYNATGDLVRSASSGANTIGRYENGVIHVNLDFGSMGVADPSVLLAGAYNPDASGATDSSTALAAADAVAYAAGKYVALGPGTYKVSANITLLASWRLAPGAVLSVDSGKTVTFSGGSFDAPKVQVFSGSGTVSLRYAKLRAVLPHWWGAKFDGSITYGVSITGGTTTLTGSSFTSALVGKTVIVFDRTSGTTSHQTTVAGYTNSTTLTLNAAAPSTLPKSPCDAVGATTTPAAGAIFVGTDDAAAWNAAIQSAAGVHMVEGEEGGVSCLGSPIILYPATGLPVKLDGRGCTFVPTTSITAALTTDNGVNSNIGLNFSTVRNFTVECGRVADYGVLLGRVSYPATFAYLSGGELHDWTIYTAKVNGVKIIASQVTHFERIRARYSSDHNIYISGCTQTVFIACSASYAVGSNKAGIYVDSDSFGSGAITLLNPDVEYNNGPGIWTVDSTAQGTPVQIIAPWCEGNYSDGVYMDRDGNLLVGGSFSGLGGATTAYPWRMSGNAHGSTVIGTMGVSGYQTAYLGGRVDAGCRKYSVDRARAYNVTTTANYNPSIADGWASTFILGAAATTTVNDSRVTTTSVIKWVPTNAAAATLEGSAKALFISARTANTSFDVTTASGVAAGNETFTYTIEEPRP